MQSVSVKNAFDGLSAKQVVLNMLTGDYYFHDCFRDCFNSAGFLVHSVQKHWFHDIFEIRLRRNGAEMDKDDTRATKQVRNLLKRNGFAISSGSIQSSREPKNRK